MTKLKTENDNSFKFPRLFIIAFLTLSLDQASKFYIYTHFSISQKKELINNLLYFIHAKNFGAAFGFLENAPDIFRSAFMITIPLLITLLVIGLLYKSDPKNKTEHISLSLVFSGATGNYIDRLNYGHVIDFIDFKFGKWSFPTFNLADAFIVSGVFMLIILLFKDNKVTN